MDVEQLRAACQIAVRLGVLAGCERCGQVWRHGTLDLEDDDGFEELLDSAEDVISAAPELDVFGDLASLRAALAEVIADAPSRRLCKH